MLAWKGLYMNNPGKSRVADLAIFSGKKLFDKFRPIGQLWAPDRTIFYELVNEIYENRRLTNNGNVVKKLEYELREVHSCEYVVAFANASIAIAAILKIINLEYYGKKNGEVILPAFTYVGLPHLVRWAGLKPIFADVDERHHTLSPEASLEKVNKNTAAILPVHQVNRPANINEFSSISNEYQIPVVFDSVHGVFCKIDNVPLGSFGLAEVFSLHATKLINGFEGGYITTNDKNLDSKLRTIRNFGINSSDNVDSIGINGKLNEIHAASALASLNSSQDIISGNKKRFEKYCEVFSGIPGLSWVEYQTHSETGEKYEYNYEFFLLEIAESWPLDRDTIVKMLRAEGALARGYYAPPVHLSSHFPKDQSVPSLPVTEKLADKFIQMPVGEMVSENDIDALGDWFLFIYQNFKQIRDKLESDVNE